MQFTNNSLFFPGQKCISLITVDSTNRYAKDLLSNSRPVADGTVILAESQTAGRGQLEGSWLSQAGKNLTFSIIVHPHFLLPEQQFLLNKVVALSVFDLLNSMGIDVSVKWPNDIICPEGKLCGILIENMLQGSRIRSSVIGIGININQPDFGGGSGAAVSLHMLTGILYNLNTVFNDFWVYFQHHYQQLSVGMSGALDSRYLNCLYGYGQSRQFETAAGIITGTITGISPSGELELESEGILRRFWLKEIKFISTGSSAF